MRLYGLTGGIASGKSTAAAEFRRLGVPVIDADLLSRALVEPGQPALAEIGHRWPRVISASGALDRAALAAVVFADPIARRALEGILHPRIRAEMRQRRAALAAEGQVPYALYEAALMFESGSDQETDGVIVVSASPDTQRRRLASRDGFSPEAAEARLRAQLSNDERRRRARWILENDGSPDELASQVQALDQSLRQSPPRASSGEGT